MALSHHIKGIKMSYLERDTYGIYANNLNGPGPRLMGANTLVGDSVYNAQEEHLGDIKEIMLNVHRNCRLCSAIFWRCIFHWGEIVCGALEFVKTRYRK